MIEIMIILTTEFVNHPLIDRSVTFTIIPPGEYHFFFEKSDPSGIHYPGMSTIAFTSDGEEREIGVNWVSPLTEAAGSRKRRGTWNLHFKL